MLLDYQQQILSELSSEDGLCVMAAGLGLTKIISALLKQRSNNKGPILILNTFDYQRKSLREELNLENGDTEVQSLFSPSLILKEVNAEYTSNDRVSLYKNTSGPLMVTSRILIVDLLNHRVPVERIQGIVVNNAHRVTETCAEAFILRLFRLSNQSAFVAAFSDRPTILSSGIGKVERIMRSLHVRRLYLWPRFQVAVSDSLEAQGANVVDLRIPLTPAMAAIQIAIVEVMDQCLKELRKGNRIDVDDLTVENGLFKSFDESIRRQLDPVWHTLGFKTKQLVKDLKTLRKVAEHLLRYDSVTFLRYLDALRASPDSRRAVWLFADPIHKLFDVAKRRVYKIVRNQNVEVLDHGKEQNTADESEDEAATDKENRKEGRSGSSNRGEDEVIELEASAKQSAPGGVVLEPVLEEMPKWRLLKETLDEIALDWRNSREASSSPSSNNCGWGAREGSVLVACKDERMCGQLREVVEKGASEVMRAEWGSYLLGKAGLLALRKRQGRKGTKGGREGSSGSPGGAGDEREALLAAADLLEVAPRKRGVPLATEREGSVLTKRKGRPPSAPGKSRRKKGKKGENVEGKEEEVEGEEGKKKGRKGSGSRRGSAFAGQQKDEEEEEEEEEEAKEGSGGSPAAAAKDRKDRKKGRREEAEDNREEEGGEDGEEGEEGEEEEEPELLVMDAEGSFQEVSDAGRGSPPPTSAAAAEDAPPVHFHALDSGDERVLDVLNPRFVVVYDPNVAFVRQVEVYQAQGCGGGGTFRAVSVFFLFYEDATESRKFDCGLRRENDAFEGLIRNKARMVTPTAAQAAAPLPLPLPSLPNSLTRKAGGGPHASSLLLPPSSSSSSPLSGPSAPMVVVDVREFSSSLPCVLHAQGLAVRPVTLEVGDYVLSRQLAVERKSVQGDLAQSLASGRLFHQAAALTRHYGLPVLLLEFQADKAFALQSPNELGADINVNNIVSKLCLLALHFPRLRFVWSRSLHATADIFAALKANQDEPDVQQAMKVGVPDEDGLLEGDARDETFNSTAVEFLQRLPGVTAANYRSIMDSCNSLAELAMTPVEKLAPLMGGMRPARMLRDFLDAKCPSLP